MRAFGGARATFVGFLALAVGIPFGCSKRGGIDGGSAGVAGRDGSGGASGGKAGSGSGAASGRSAGGRGGSGAVSGSGAASGEAGVGAAGETAAGNGGRGTGGSTNEAGEGGMGGASSCEELVATATLVPSTVTLLVDNSSSMFETVPSAWTPLYQSLMDPTFGVVKALEGKIRFGFAAYRGSTVPTLEDDPVTGVPVAERR